jgi:hypothetical protein
VSSSRTTSGRAPTTIDGHGKFAEPRGDLLNVSFLRHRLGFSAAAGAVVDGRDDSPPLLPLGSFVL